jgi:hypothetical protein
MTRRVLAVALFLSALSTSLAATTARAGAPADAHSVLLIGGGPQFRDAMKVALSPWQLRVTPLDSPAPRPVMPRAADEARALAAQFGATGLVWVAMEQNEPSLWVYDASTDQVVTRKIATTPPFDAPTAAAAALTVKTLLRASTVAPAEERLGAGANADAGANVNAGAGAGANADANASSDAGADSQNARNERDTRDDEPTGGPGRAAVVRAELELQGRALASAVDTRVGAGVSVWLGSQRRLGLAIAGSFGPGLSVSEARFAGRFSEVGAAPSIRLRLPLTRRLVLEPRIGSSLHATTIDGVAVLAARSASTSRLDGSIDAALALDVLLTPQLGVAIDAGASAMLRYQRYIVESDSIFELRPVQGFLGLRLTTSLF